MYLRNVGICLQVHRALQLRKRLSTSLCSCFSFYSFSPSFNFDTPVRNSSPFTTRGLEWSVRFITRIKSLKMRHETRVVAEVWPADAGCGWLGHSSQLSAETSDTALHSGGSQSTPSLSYSLKLLFLVVFLGSSRQILWQYTQHLPRCFVETIFC